MENKIIGDDYIAIKAISQSVQIIGLTRGDGTKPQHTENLNCGEVFIVQFTENISAMKFRGKAEVYTKFGKIICGDDVCEK